MTSTDRGTTAPARNLPARWVGAADDRPMLLVVLGTLLFSTGPVMVGASTGSGPVLSFYRLWFGAAVLGVVLLWRRRSGGIWTSRSGWRWAGLAGLAFGIHQLLFMTAIKATSVVDVTLMQVVMPVLVGVLARLLFGERPGAAFRLWSGLAVLGAGIVVVAGTAGPDGDPVGMALAFGNVFFGAFYLVWSKRAMSHMGAVPFLFGVSVVAACAVSLYVTLAGEPVTGISTRDLLIALFIAVVPGVLGHVLSTHPMDRLPANIPPVVQLAVPFVSGGLAWLLLDERITLLHVLGGAVSIAGVVGALTSRGVRQMRADAANAERVPTAAAARTATSGPAAGAADRSPG